MTIHPAHILTTLRNTLAAITATNPTPRHPFTADDHTRQAVKDIHAPHSYGDESYCRECQAAYPCPTIRVASGQPLTPCTSCTDAHLDRGIDLWQEPVVHPQCAQAIQPRPVADAPAHDDSVLDDLVSGMEQLADTAEPDAHVLDKNLSDATAAEREVARLRLRIAYLEREQAIEQQRTARRTQALNARLDAVRNYAEHTDTPDEVRQDLTDLLDATAATDESWRREPQWLDLATSFVKAW